MQLKTDVQSVSRVIRWRYHSAVQAARVLNALGRQREPRTMVVRMGQTGS